MRHVLAMSHCAYLVLLQVVAIEVSRHEKLTAVAAPTGGGLDLGSAVRTELVVALGTHLLALEQREANRTRVARHLLQHVFMECTSARDSSCNVRITSTK